MRKIYRLLLKVFLPWILLKESRDKAKLLTELAEAQGKIINNFDEKPRYTTISSFSREVDEKNGEINPKFIEEMAKISYNEPFMFLLFSMQNDINKNFTDPKRKLGEAELNILRGQLVGIDLLNSHLFMYRKKAESMKNNAQV